MLFITLVMWPILILVLMSASGFANEGWVAFWIVIGIIGLMFGLTGFFTQEPNEARVMIFFGKYVGTCSNVGYFWANPFVTRKKMSLRIRNIDIDPIKVNDRTGNPIMIGMVLVWRLRDTYRAAFDVDTTGNAGFSADALENFVNIQGDAALREVTGHYAYDSDDPRQQTLRGSGDEISSVLENKINDRVAMAGIEVVEARINYLAYAPEIAAVMLRRQQASAIISAREKIVEGAVSMVKMALESIEAQNVAHFTPEQRAAMVSNLLVVLCSEEPAQPVLQAGA